MTPMDVSDNE
jgi:hypothetical protein